MAPRKSNRKIAIEKKSSSKMDLTTFSPKKVVVSLLKLQESVDYEATDIVYSSSKLSRSEKALLIPKKNLNKAKQGGKIAKRGSKIKKQTKFNLKILKTKDDLDLSDGEEDQKDDLKTDRPDSGFSSRADTPAVWSDAGSKSGSPSKKEEDLKEEMEKENKRFLDELDEGLTSSSDESEASEWDGDSDDEIQKKKSKAKHKPPKAKKGRKKAVVPMVVPGALKSEMSAYELIRANNIKEREDMLAAIMADFSAYKTDVGLGGNGTNNSQSKKKYKRKEKIVAPTELRRSTRQSTKPEDKDKLGSSRWETDRDGKTKLAEEYSDYDSDDYEVYNATAKKRNSSKLVSKDPNDDFLMPEDITETMLGRVCDRFGDKTYSQEIGTSCHQCRQKTTDMKTICRSGECVGVRGQFCGRCLLLRYENGQILHFPIFDCRYGEDAREALMDPEWKCPPCRNFCNCSICRNRLGKGATGILIQLAKSKGYSNVAEYLKALQTK